MTITASRLPLLVNCSAPASPAFWLKKDRTGDSAKFGNAIHLLAEMYIKQHPHSVEAACIAEGVAEPEHARAGRVWANLLAWLPGEGELTGMRAEVPYGWDMHTGQATELKLSGKREYLVGPTCIAGTADIVLLADGKLSVWDIKTGFSSPESYRWQQRALGCMAMIATGATECRVAILHAGEVECAETWVEHLDRESVVDLTDLLKDLLADSKKANPRPGPHCDAHYCGGRDRCNTYRAAFGKKPYTGKVTT